MDDLLDASRITGGKIRIRRERVNLAALLGPLLEDHRPLCAAAGLRLELAEGPLWVDGDTAQMAQMIDGRSRAGRPEESRATCRPPPRVSPRPRRT